MTEKTDKTKENIHPMIRMGLIVAFIFIAPLGVKFIINQPVKPETDVLFEERYIPSYMYGIKNNPKSPPFIASSCKDVVGQNIRRVEKHLQSDAPYLSAKDMLSEQRQEYIASRRTMADIITPICRNELEREMMEKGYRFISGYHLSNFDRKYPFEKNVLYYRFSKR